MEINIERKDWETWLQAKQLSARTILEYSSYLDKLDIKVFNQNQILQFIERYNNPVARAFVSNLLLYLKSGEFPAEVNDVMRKIEIPKITGRKKKRLPDILSLEQVGKIAGAMNSERDRIMVLLSFYGGLRVSELIGIKPYDFNWNTWMNKPAEIGRVKIIGKNNKQRTIFAPQRLMARIYQWIKNSVVATQGKDDPLFRIGQRRWKYILSSAADKAIGKHINPHMLRHSCGTWLRDNGWDLKEIAEYLGHESIMTTQIYTQISQEKLQEKFDKLSNT